MFNARKAAELAAIGLHSMQSRAQDFAGITTSDGENFYTKRGPGIVRQVFTKDALDRLHGLHAIGHTRYPTVEDTPYQENIQPIEGIYGSANFYLIHNGNLTNQADLIKILGINRFKTSMDTELIVRLLEKYSTGDIIADLSKVCKMLQGSYCLILLFKDSIIAICDPTTNRPLSIGTSGAETICIASETCAFETLDMQFLERVEPGTFVHLTNTGIERHRFAKAVPKKCLFELVYFSQPTSNVFGIDLMDYRERIGRKLEEAYPVPGADIVVGVPDSGNLFAIGYGASGRSGKFLPVITRNHYVGRSFIEASQELRDAQVAQKFQISPDAVRGKRIVVVDDSIVRLTTMPVIVRRLRAAGAKEVHVRIAFPPVKHPCIYGINTPQYSELVASRLSIDIIRKQLKADSLAYIDLEDLIALTDDAPENWCTACVTGQYWQQVYA